MLPRIIVLVLFVTVCFGLPQGGPEKPSSRYTCECSPVPSDDGILTLQCHCTEKANNNLPVINPGDSSGNNVPPDGSKPTVPPPGEGEGLGSTTPETIGVANSTVGPGGGEPAGNSTVGGPVEPAGNNNTSGPGEPSGNNTSGGPAGGLGEPAGNSTVGGPVEPAGNNNTSGPGEPSGNNTSGGPAGNNKTGGLGEPSDYGHISDYGEPTVNSTTGGPGGLLGGTDVPTVNGTTGGHGEPSDYGHISDLGEPTKNSTTNGTGAPTGGNSGEFDGTTGNRTTGFFGGPTGSTNTPGEAGVPAGNGTTGGPSAPTGGLLGEPTGNNTAAEPGISAGNNTAAEPGISAGNNTAGGASPSAAPPVGDATTYVACTKRDDKASPTGRPDYDWLKSDGTDVQIPGKWVNVPCKGGSKYVFITDETTYKKSLAGCKAQGFEFAQPADHTLSGYYGFQVGETVQEYFSWPSMLTWNRMKAEPVEGCSLYGGDTAGQSFGDTTTSILCIKKGDAKTSTKPEWKWLPDPSWGTAKISGSWQQARTCTYGDITPFQVLEFEYKNVLEACKKEGFDIAQPANSATSSWNPFQIGKELQEYYRSAKSGWVSSDYFLEATVIADKC